MKKKRVLEYLTFYDHPPDWKALWFGMAAGLLATPFVLDTLTGNHRMSLSPGSILLRLFVQAVLCLSCFSAYRTAAKYLQRRKARRVAQNSEHETL